MSGKIPGFLSVFFLLTFWFSAAFSKETAKDSSQVQSETPGFFAVQSDSTIALKPDSAITIFKDGSTQHSRRFNNKQIHSILRRGKQTIYGRLRWARTLSPAVNIQVGFMVMDKKNKKLRVLCSALTRVCPKIGHFPLLEVSQVGSFPGFERNIPYHPYLSMPLDVFLVHPGGF